MKKLKYIAFIITFVLILYIASWHIIMNKVLSEIKNSALNQQFTIKSFETRGKLDKTAEFKVSFEDIAISGFPFSFGFKIIGLQEESEATLIDYKNPVHIVYSPLMSDLKISYSGDINAAYKPVHKNFGSIIEIQNYVIKISLESLSYIFDILKNKKDNFEFINIVKNVRVSSSSMLAKDIYKKEIYTNKNHEELYFDFKKPKYYTSLADFIVNIPSIYELQFSSSAGKSDAPDREYANGYFILYAYITKQY